MPADLAQIIASAITLVPGGLALAVLYSVYRNTRQDYKDMLEINKGLTEALRLANKTVDDQNVLMDRMTRG